MATPTCVSPKFDIFFCRCSNAHIKKIKSFDINWQLCLRYISIYIDSIMIWHICIQVSLISRRDRSIYTTHEVTEFMPSKLLKLDKDVKDACKYERKIWILSKCENREQLHTSLRVRRSLLSNFNLLLNYRYSFELTLGSKVELPLFWANGLK